MRKWLQIAFTIQLFLNLTNLFVFIPPWTGIPLSLIGGLMLLLNMVYLFDERDYALELMRHKLTWALMILFFFWPVIWSAYPIISGYSLKREILLQTFYVTTLLGSAVFVRRLSYSRARLLLYVSFGVSVIGILAQALLPGLFFAIARIAEGSGEVFAYGRAAGFFVNPNVAGRFIVLFYLVLMLSAKKIGAVEMILLSLVSFCAVLFTASRSSLLIAIVVIIYVVGHRFAVPYIRGHLSFQPARFVLGGIAVLVFALLALFILPVASRFVLDKTDVGATKNASARFEMFAYGIDGFVESVENEALNRWYTVEPYVAGFDESWILGRGLAGYRIYKKEHNLLLTPHNTIFAMWLNYGVFYVLFGSVCFIAVLLSPRMRHVENHLGMSFSLILFLALIGIMFTYDGLFAQRGFYVLIGAFLAEYSAPQHWFQYDKLMAHQSFFRKRRK
jgi:hypothetical protein